MTAHRLRMTLALTGVWGLTALLGGCHGSTGKGKDAAAVAAPVAVPVTVETLKTSRIRDVVELDGSVAPMQQVNLVARVSGNLEKAPFKDGDRVKKGQVLFVIEQQSYQDQLKLNQARLDQTRADYNRQSELLRENANSQSNVETSLSNLKQAQANVDLARLNLDYTVVKAPFDGIIGRRQVDPGNFVGATQGGTVLATLMEVSPALVYASIGEREALRIRAKLPAGSGAEKGVGRAVVYAKLQDDTGPGEAGVLDFLDHQVNQTSGTVQLRGRFQNRDYHLLPGFYAKLIINIGPDRDALVLPRAVVQNDQQGDFLFVVGEDNAAHRRNVTTSALPDEKAEVLTGVKAGDRIVIQGASGLADGEPVQVVDPGTGA